MLILLIFKQHSYNCELDLSIFGQSGEQKAKVVHLLEKASFGHCISRKQTLQPAYILGLYVIWCAVVDHRKKTHNISIWVQFVVISNWQLCHVGIVVVLQEWSCWGWRVCRESNPAAVSRGHRLLLCRAEQGSEWCKAFIHAAADWWYIFHGRPVAYLTSTTLVCGRCYFWHWLMLMLYAHMLCE